MNNQEKDLLLFDVPTISNRATATYRVYTHRVCEGTVNPSSDFGPEKGLAFSRSGVSNKANHCYEHPCRVFIFDYNMDYLADALTAELIMDKICGISTSAVISSLRQQKVFEYFRGTNYSEGGVDYELSGMTRKRCQQLKDALRARANSTETIDNYALDRLEQYKGEFSGLMSISERFYFLEHKDRLKIEAHLHKMHAKARTR